MQRKCREYDGIAHVSHAKHIYLQNYIVYTGSLSPHVCRGNSNYFLPNCDKTTIVMFENNYRVVLHLLLTHMVNVYKVDLKCISALIETQNIINTYWNTQSRISKLNGTYLSFKSMFSRINMSLFDELNPNSFINK